jgi:hypothetical protein
MVACGMSDGKSGGEKKTVLAYREKTKRAGRKTLSLENFHDWKQNQVWTEE